MGCCLWRKGGEKPRPWRGSPDGVGVFAKEDPSPGRRKGHAGPRTLRSPSAFQMTRTIPIGAVREGPEMPHSQLGEKEHNFN